MNNILFLDFDGVIRVTPDGCIHNTVAKAEFCPRRISYIESFCSTHNIKIVVSSDWRNLDNKDRIIELLGNKLASHLHEDWSTPICGQRYEEVERWLDEHEVGKFAVLEDSEFHFPKSVTNSTIFNNIIWCEWSEGIQLHHFTKLEEIFN